MGGMPRLKIYEVEKEKMDETAQNLRLWSPTVFQICPVFKTINITEWHLTKQIFHQSNIFFGQFFRIMVLFLSILTMMFLPNMLPTNWFTLSITPNRSPLQTLCQFCICSFCIGYGQIDKLENTKHFQQNFWTFPSYHTTQNIKLWYDT